MIHMYRLIRRANKREYSILYCNQIFLYNFIPWGEILKNEKPKIDFFMKHPPRLQNIIIYTVFIIIIIIIQTGQIGQCERSLVVQF